MLLTGQVALIASLVTVGLAFNLVDWLVGWGTVAGHSPPPFLPTTILRDDIALGCEFGQGYLFARPSDALIASWDKVSTTYAALIKGAIGGYGPISETTAASVPSRPAADTTAPVVELGQPADHSVTKARRPSIMSGPSNTFGSPCPPASRYSAT